MKPGSQSGTYTMSQEIQITEKKKNTEMQKLKRYRNRNYINTKKERTEYRNTNNRNTEIQKFKQKYGNTNYRYKL